MCTASVVFLKTSAEGGCEEDGQIVTAKRRDKERSLAPERRMGKMDLTAGGRESFDGKYSFWRSK